MHRIPLVGDIVSHVYGVRRDLRPDQKARFYVDRMTEELDEKVRHLDQEGINPTVSQYCLQTITSSEALRTTFFFLNHLSFILKMKTLHSL